MTTTFQRARQPAQKEQRRAHLLATARALLEDDVPLRALSLSELARRADMSKANVYTYFESREALLLALLQHEWERWWSAWQAHKTLAGRRPLALDDVVALLARSLADAPLLCELTAALPTVIEQNLSCDAIRIFKRYVIRLFAQAAEHLAARCPALSAPAYAQLLHDAASSIIGLYPTTHPSPAAARVLAEPEMRFFLRDFPDELSRFIGSLARDHARRVEKAAVRVIHRELVPSTRVALPAKGKTKAKAQSKTKATTSGGRRR